MKRWCLFLLAIIAVQAVRAQKSERSFTFGPRVGVNVASLYDKDVESIRNFKAALCIGGFIEGEATKWLGISLDILYSRQGCGTGPVYLTTGSFGKKTEGHMNLNYLNLPVLANFYVCKGLALKTGIQPGILLSAKWKIKDQDPESLWDAYSKVDVSIPVGISYAFRCGLVLDCRYQIPIYNVAGKGFQDLIKGTYDEKMNRKVRNRVISILAGWKF